MGHYDAVKAIRGSDFWGGIGRLQRARRDTDAGKSADSIVVTGHLYGCSENCYGIHRQQDHTRPHRTRRTELPNHREGAKKGSEEADSQQYSSHFAFNTNECHPLAYALTCPPGMFPSPKLG